MHDYSNEQWKPVTGYEGLYEVSDHGRVRSVARTVTRKDGVRRPYPALLRKLGIHRGYKIVRLYRANRGKTFGVHKLVMEAFEGAPPEGMETRHVDGDATNNHFGNLTYGSKKENIRDRLIHGTDHNSRKDNCPQGHPYTGLNLGIHERKSGNRAGERHRFCVSCTRARAYIRNHGGDLQEVSDRYYRAIG